MLRISDGVSGTDKERLTELLLECLNLLHKQNKPHSPPPFPAPTKKSRRSENASLALVNDKSYSVAETAILLGRAEVTVRNMIRDGHIRSEKSKGRVLISGAEIMRTLAARANETQDE